MASEFRLDWSQHDWAPAGNTGPVIVPLSDQYGFEIDARIAIVGEGGRAVAGYPDDLPGFGIGESLWIVWDPDPGRAMVGGSTSTVTLSIETGGQPVETASIAFTVADIDAADGRCDFVTFGGNAGAPLLSPLATEDGATVRIGPRAGAGATGRLGPDQAQCRVAGSGDAGSGSDADDRGSVRADYPAGTHTVTIAYDESMADVLGDAALDAGPRGIGVLAGLEVSVPTALALDRTSTPASYATAGERIAYRYRVTNLGPLPINPGQTVLIDDDRIGVFACAPVTEDVPPGETVDCAAEDTATQVDLAAPRIVSTATAGVGLPGQPFSARLRSQPATLSTPNANADLVTTVARVSPGPVLAEGDPVRFVVTVENRGPAVATGVELSVPMPDGLTADEGSGRASAGAWSADGTWRIETIAVGESATLALSGTMAVGAGPTLAVAASRAVGAQNDPDQAGDDLGEVVSVSADADLVTQFAIRSAVPFPAPGDPVELVVSVRNAGPAPADAVTVPVDLPFGFGLASAEASVGQFDAGTGLWTIGPLPRGAAVELALRGEIATGQGEALQFAGKPAVSLRPDPRSDGDTLRAELPLAKSELSIDGEYRIEADRDGDGIAGPGDTVRYTYTVSNAGNVPILDVRVDATSDAARIPAPRVTAIRDNPPFGDSDGRIGVPSWRRLGPGDVLIYVADIVIGGQADDNP